MSRVRSTVLVCMALALAAPSGAVQAQQSMDLPPQEDRDLWTRAWLEVIGDKHSPEFIPRLLVKDDGAGWSLTVWNAEGRARTVVIQQPHDHADRVDLLYLAVSLARPRDDWGWSAVQGATTTPPNLSIIEIQP